MVDALQSYDECASRSRERWYVYGALSISAAPNNSHKGECDNACQLAQALGKTGVYTLTTPHPYVCFFGASALIAGTITGAAPAARLAAAYAPEIMGAVTGFSKFVTNDLQFQAGATITAVGGALVAGATAVANYNPCTQK